MQHELCLSALPELFILLEDKEDTPHWSRLDWISTLLLTDNPLLLIFLAKPEPKIRILCGAQYGTPLFAHATPEDDTVLTLARYVRLDYIPTTVEIKAEWLMFRDVATPSIAELDQALENRVLRSERLPDATAMFNTFAIARVTIAPLLLLHLLLRSTLLAPVNTWNIFIARAD